MLKLEKNTWSMSNVLVSIVKFVLQILGLDLLVVRCQNLTQITPVMDFTIWMLIVPPTEVDGEARAIDDFQPRKQAADQMKEKKLESEEQVDTF